MQNLKKKDERGVTETSWLDSRHTFSFGDYYDAANMGFGPLRVINEDTVKPEGGFGTHGHKNMEIITWVLSGAIEHKDSLGNGSVIRPGEVQMMSAGKGILHSEFNPSDSEPVHFLQIWIMPKDSGTKPTYQQTRFDPAEAHNKLRLAVSPDGAENSLKILQDARLWFANIDAGMSLLLDMRANKKYWLQVARGKVTLTGRKLEAGDGLGFDNEAVIEKLAAGSSAEVLFFELPR